MFPLQALYIVFHYICTIYRFPLHALYIGFHYMRASASHGHLLKRFSADVPELTDLSWQKIQSVGPSPLIISKTQLATITPLWLKLSLLLKRDAEADKRFGWVLEM